MVTLKKTEIGFLDQFSLNVGGKYCRMLQGEHSVILSTFIKLPFFFLIFVLSIFEWPFYKGFTVSAIKYKMSLCLTIKSQENKTKSLTR